MVESIRHIDLLKDCIERKEDYYLIFRDKEGKIQIAYSHDFEGKFKKEVFDILLKKSLSKTKKMKCKHCKEETENQDGVCNRCKNSIFCLF